ncbi:hypothetical protein COX24_03245 [bacterium (Candidatus Gribaldobacteria) CG23_combo_of_CG06-09_8_20_14_all_37_87_8]|uniref:Uncharacterized protein n=2 Tax=Candidatus Gribaldobacteria TaxID=2798536 RepID=A0A2G9ZEA5_9BACT|nr:MAG: hypothetical protein COX24_03245 [bacterium (Candidatus Gribaldobacteria) CG23_combo_of_CG06-09_8_20_14_all_37_87_8]PIR90299.1 MAG: hypothetical protein COU05_02700 [bacterium (Candidatus Gribaldobacteria) CG10_big_fil_rev_8_21_14_0_10_37_21]
MIAFKIVSKTIKATVSRAKLGNNLPLSPPPLHPDKLNGHISQIESKVVRVNKAPNIIAPIALILLIESIYLYLFLFFNLNTFLHPLK